MGFLFQGVGLAGRIALLDDPLVAEEGRGVERVLAHLAVGEMVLGLQPHPEGGHRGVRQQDRMALHVGDGPDALIGVGDQHLRVLLHEGRHRLNRRLLLGQVHDDEAVGAHAEVDGVGSQELGHVHAGPALDDLNIEPTLGVLAGGQGLVEAPLLGLGVPVGGELQARQASGRGGRRRGRRRLRLRTGGEHQGCGERDQA